jgi:iron complex transport system substrate-binding protein
VHIASLIPEATEILGHLGLGDDVVVAFPEDTRDSDRLASDLRAARPTLIFTSKTRAGGGVPRADVRRAVGSLRPRPVVYALEPSSLGAILSDVKTVGDATGRQGPARGLIEALRARIDATSLRSARALAEHRARPVVCLSSIDPPIAAGWWLAELVGLAGGFDVLDGIGRPPRPVTWDEIGAGRPEIVILVKPECPQELPRSPTASPQALSVSWATGASGQVSLSPAYGERGRGVRGSGDPPEKVLGGRLHPGPSAVDLLERLAALILPQT